MMGTMMGTMTQQQQQRKVALQARVEQVRRDLETAIAEVQEEIRYLEALLAAKREAEQLQQHSFRALNARETTMPVSGEKEVH